MSQADEKKEQAPRTIDHFIVATEEEYTKVTNDMTKREDAEAVSSSPLLIMAS
ncbi:MAG: hypothetical protein OXC67_01795 [Flavobacteriaceae bacterium]|nr:hypothetical protein [Flavobacteriaceae bacterium]MCY4297973.1 hypothetical protein [Flavobacteriaceae bacterium]